MRNVFDIAQATEAREEALRRVEQHAMQQWKGAVDCAIRMVASKRHLFTTDAVWHVLEQLSDIEPHEPRALGAAMRKAAKAGVCVKTNETRESVRVACHRRPVAVWKSRICSN